MTDTLDPRIVQIVDDSYGRCLLNPRFLFQFYEIFMDRHELIRPLFAETDFDQQTKALRHGLGMMIRYMDDPTDIVVIDGLKRIRRSHGQHYLNIHPRLYDYWFDSLLQAISKCDPMYNERIKKAWGIALKPGIEFIRSGYSEE